MPAGTFNPWSRDPVALGRRRVAGSARRAGGRGPGNGLLRKERMQAAAAIARGLTGGLKPGEILRIVRAQVRPIVGGDCWALARLDRGKRSWDLTAVEGQSDGNPGPRGRLPLDHPLLAPILEFPGAPFFGCRRPRPESDGRDLPFGVEIGSYILLPLMTRGRLAGALVLGNTTGATLDRTDRDFLGLVADQTALALENAHLSDQVRRARARLDHWLEADQDRAVISVGREGIVLSFSPGAERMLNLSASEAVGRGIAQVVGSSDLRAVFSELRQTPHPRGWEGRIRIRRVDGSTLRGEAHLRPLEPFSGFLLIIADVSRQVELERQLKRLTVTDDLTGLYNQRDLFEQLPREMERANRAGSACSLCLFDLDRFKDYNDTHGHLAGDRLLRSVGAVVSRTIRAKIDRAFRYGGDEFVLLLPNTNRAKAQVLVDRLRRAISQALAGAVTFSAGIAEYSPGMESKDFIEAADRLMYRAKRKGGVRMEPGTAGAETGRR